MADLKENADSLLASVVVNLNDAVVSTLFTVPTGKRCIITKVIMREPDGAVGTAELTFGFNGTATDVMATPTQYGLTGTTNYIIIYPDDDAVRGVAAGTFKIDVETAEGGARTATIDVFGYLYDTP